MLRNISGFYLKLFSIVLAIGFLYNVILLLPRISNIISQEPNHNENHRENNKVVGLLPMPEYEAHKGLLLGTKASKVTLAFGMIVSVNALNQVAFAETARQIIQQDPQPGGSRSLVIILLLCENRKSKIEKIFDVLKNDFAGSLLQGYIQLVISPFDANPKHFNALYRNSKIHQVSKTSAKTNMRISYLMHYSAGEAENLIIIDDTVRLAGNALSEIYKQIYTMPPRSLQIDFDLSKGLSGRLYSGKFLPRLSSLLHTMAFAGTLSRMLAIYIFSSVNETANEYKKNQLFIQETKPLNNPRATIISSFSNINKISLENAYLGKGKSWFTTPNKGNSYIIKLDYPTLLKRIAIDVGIDSFTQDSITEAVVELGYEKDIHTKECSKYSTVKSFEESASIEISHDKEDDKPLLQKPIHCIRIRVTKSHKEWGAIRMIVIEPE